MKEWTLKKVTSVRHMIQQIKEVRKKQDELFRELEFQMSLVEQGIDPHDVTKVFTRDRIHGRPVIQEVRTSDGRKHKVSPPVKVFDGMMIRRKE